MRAERSERSALRGSLSRFALVVAALAGALMAPCCAWAQPLYLGTTFSQKQCVYLGMDWKEAYLATLELDLDFIRLGAYWDELEPEPGVFNFEALDWQMAQAKKKGKPVILVIGMKAPRWPEFFIPGWLLKQLELPRGGDVARRELLRKRTLQMVRTVLERYRDQEHVQYWQVENEAFDRSGPSFWWIHPEFVEQEIRLVKSLDFLERPVILTTATFPNRFLRIMMRLFGRRDALREARRLGDILALNIYPIIGHQWTWKRSYYRTRLEGRRHYLEPLLKELDPMDKPIWVSELQAEPWEPGHLVYTDQPHPTTSHPDMLGGYVQEMRDLGIEAVLLWGVEYWYYRKVKQDDPSWWDSVSALLASKR